MKKQLLAAALLASMTTGTAIASDYSGFRIGVGGVSGQEYKIDELANGESARSNTRAKIEIGYDFNRVFSLNGSVSGFNGAVAGTNGTQYGGTDIRARDIRVEAEVGYAFNVAKGWDIKPYVAVGGAHISGTQRGFTGGLVSLPASINEFGSEKFKGNYLTTAAGVRLNTPADVYVDLRVQKLQMNANQKANSIVKDNAQAALSFGVKF
ncbi:hypothetical protein JCM19240_2421 [Vibrio maritimus]|uniref:Outer membrane protein beta-barrel domain-containing protein n=1 Tax=Vibrio maritimus TaxID=990268 RepID=A0A090T134_9VIBR|nr:hypothetical protein JCM19240_2421 [Vibrio maritimus]